MLCDWDNASPIRAGAIRRLAGSRKRSRERGRGGMPGHAPGSLVKELEQSSARRSRIAFHNLLKVELVYWILGKVIALDTPIEHHP